MPTLKEWFVLGVIIVLFVASAFISQYFSPQLEATLSGYATLGMLSYVFITTLSTVLAPFNTLFLLPLASTLWGPAIAALLSIAGWTIGSVIAYALARRYGRPIVARFIDTSRIEYLRSSLPSRYLFVWLIFARMAVSVDVLSYALGLLLPIPYGTYTIATLIGVAPFAFVLAYSSTLPAPYMVGALSAALIATLSGAWLLYGGRSGKRM